MNSRRFAWLTAGGCCVVLSALWALDLFVIRTPVLTPFGDKSALTPLYAFFSVRVRWTASLFPAAAIALVWLAPRLVNPERTGRGRFAAILAGLAIALPLLLFLVRQSPGLLGTQLTIYPGEEVYYDALRIEGLGEFYRGYTEWMPRLSLHGKHFPPGHATWIHLVGRAFGDGVLPVALATLLMSGAGCLCAWRGLAVAVGESAARHGALLLLACPALLDFACTSMDAVFFAAAAAALWAGLAALAPSGRASLALPAGIALLLATMLSFSALPLGLVLLLYGLFSARGRLRAGIVRLGRIGLTYALSAILLGWVTGFDLWRCFSVARELNESFMSSVIGRSPLDLYPQIAYGNLSAFSIGAGLALISALALRFLRRPRGFDPFSLAALCTLGVMGLGAVYQMETERIWLFCMPWVALVAVGGERIPAGVLRILVGLGLLQALVFEALLFTLW